MMRPLMLIACLLLSIPCSAQQKRHWYKSGRFWLGTAIIVGSVVADVETTESAIGRGAVEANPLYGTRPSRPRAYAIGFAFAAPEMIGLGYAEGVDHPWHWWIPLVGLGAGVHIGAAIHNNGVCDNGTCDGTN